MSSTNHKLRLSGALAVLATLALAASCRGFFPPHQLASITIQPSTVNVPLGGTLQMRAFGTYTDNTPAGDVTSKVSWTAPQNSPVSVTSSGLASGSFYSTAPTTITASYQALSPQSGTANVCVDNATTGSFKILPDKGSVPFNGTLTGGGFTASVEVPNVAGTLDVTPAVTWTSSNTAVLTIINGGDPALITWGSTAITTNTSLTITANYSCNGVAITTSTTLEVTTQ
jgi:hypothetical protein